MGQTVARPFPGPLPPPEGFPPGTAAARGGRSPAGRPWQEGVFAGARLLAEIGQELAVAGRFHAFGRHEAQGGGVHAVALAGRSRAVREDVAEVGIGDPASHFGAARKQAVVGPLGHGVRADGLGELGQPVPESYLSRELKSGSPETMST